MSETDRTWTFRSIAELAGVTTRSVKLWWEKERQETGRELGEIAQGTRWFSSWEKEVLLSYASKKPVPRMAIAESEAAAVEVVDLALPDSFDVGAMVAAFDGAVGQIADVDEAVSVVGAVLAAGKNALGRKIEAQRIALQEAEKAESEVDEMVRDGLVDLKLLAMESRLLATKQTEATQRLQSKVAKVTSLGKPGGAA